MPVELYDQIADNGVQRQECVRLFAIDEIDRSLLGGPSYSEPLTIDFLRENLYLMLDTALFSEFFRDRLLSSIEDLDAAIDGMIVDAEIFRRLH